MKPTFLLIGAAKCGSTSLYHLLRAHPDVFLTTPKEIHFFSFDEVFARGTEWYESWFDDAGDAQERGEASQSYTIQKIFPDAARRIHEYDPNLKLLYIARNPIEKIESLWIQLRCQDPRYPGGFLKAREEILVDPSFNDAVRLQSDALVESANYWREISTYRSYFPDAQIKVVFFEEFRQNQAAVLRDCFEFLGVDPEHASNAPAKNVNASTDHLEPGKILSLLRATPQRRQLFHTAAKVIPQPVRAMLSRHLRSPMSQRPGWNRETRDWVVQTLRSDTEKFLEFYGRPRDYWQLHEPAHSSADVISG